MVETRYQGKIPVYKPCHGISFNNLFNTLHQASSNTDNFLSQTYQVSDGTESLKVHGDKYSLSAGDQ